MIFFGVDWVKICKLPITGVICREMLCFLGWENDCFFLLIG